VTLIIRHLQEQHLCFMSTNEALTPVAHLDHLPHLADMAVFARVVDAGSFSGAPGSWASHPSAVSRQVARLEGACCACVCWSAPPASCG
jgi:hypothetical protein